MTLDPSALVARLEEAMPGFSDHYLDWGHLYSRGSEHPVFAACANYIQLRPLPTGAWPRLAKVINEIVDGPDSALAEAACNSFLAGITPPGHPIERHLEGKARRVRLARNAEALP